MKRIDALFNWLQMVIVSGARPDDQAAKDTLDFFAQILIEDHQLTNFRLELTDEETVHVHYEVDGQLMKQSFDRDRSEQLLTDINSNPKYNE